MKTVIIGDIHGRNIWKEIVDKETPDRVIFIGDYFDSFDINGIDQIYNFKEIVHFANNSGKEVVMLIGNHDIHYLRSVKDTSTSGYQRDYAIYISIELDTYKDMLKVAYRLDDVVFSHAGISSVYMNNQFGIYGWNEDNMIDKLNDLLKYKPNELCFTGKNPYGDDLYQTPLWIRPRSLMKANYDNLKNKVVQVVGHTQVDKIDIKGNSTGKRYFFIDCLGTSKEYLIYQNGEFTTNRIFI